jgi:hypothetical protein
MQALADKVQISEYGVRDWLPMSPADIEEYLNALNVLDRKRDLCPYWSRKD